MIQKIAIIGAGFAGLLLANKLKNTANITVFEKARGVGGRMSTRYADPFYFDHGCQYFTAQSAEFQEFLRPFLVDGIVQEWHGDIAILENGNILQTHNSSQTHYVATPNMNGLCKKLSERIDVKLSTEIIPIGHKRQDGWHLHAKTGEDLGVFDMVISTAPPKQTITLFGNSLPETSKIHTVQHQGCYALMLGFDTPLQLPWKAANIQSSPFHWVAVNSTKPNRNQNNTCLVALTEAKWSEAHIDDNMKAAEAFLIPEFVRSTAIDVAKANFVALHRWRYATMDHDYKLTPFYDGSLKLASVSDWPSASTIEQVWHNVQDFLRKI